jgi:type I restriction enzyme S subunit
MTRPNLNAVAILPAEHEGAVASTGFHVLRAHQGISPRWLYYLVRSGDFIKAMSSLVLGVLYPAVRPKDIRNYPILLPPAAEQNRIVAEIEKQFTRLDAAVAALKRVQANLKRYRAAVLKAACEGRLVPTEVELARRDGRQPEAAPDLTDARVSGATKTPRRRVGRLWGSGSVPQLTDAERSRLPVGWIWSEVRALGAVPDEVVQVGPMSMRSEDFTDSGVPVLNVGCVDWGRFRESRLDFLPQEKASAFGRYRIETGDVLFTRSGTVGRCAVAQPHQSDWLMTFHLLRVRTDPNRCLADYLRMVFEGAPHIRRQTREASIGTTRAGFNTNLLASLDVPVPPVSEQRRIVAEVDRHLSIIDELGLQTHMSLLRADRLRQGILRFAFEGHLVPQDPGDEPASLLLERVKAERQTKDAAAPPARRPARGQRKRTRGDRPLLQE